jgi:SAM-dependent methyltransferase
MSNEKILDLGCGARKTPGSLGLDRENLPGVDVVHDLETYPYPLQTNQFDRIVMRHAAEHVDDVVKLMEEVHRIGKPGAIVTIYAPHYTSTNSYRDPTHKHHFSLFSFDFFCGDTVHGYLVKTPFKFLKRRVEFWTFRDSWGWVPAHTFGVRWLVNHHPNFYERFLAFLFPIKEFSVELEIVK